MAAAILGYFANVYGEDYPITVIVEPEKADCCFRTAKANDGELHFVTSDMDTIMAGLACGEPTQIGWPILRDYADGFISCADAITAYGMRILGAPMKDDPRVIAGESGAVGVGVVAELMQNPDFEQLRKQLKLDSSSKVLFFSTEGDTDAINYRKIVWNGTYAL